MTVLLVYEKCRKLAVAEPAPWRTNVAMGVVIPAPFLRNVAVAVDLSQEP